MLNAQRTSAVRPPYAAATLILVAFALEVALPVVSAAESQVHASHSTFTWSRVPPGVTSSQAVMHLRVDGVPLQVLEVRAPLPRDELTEVWRGWWNASAFVVVESRASGWRVLSIRHGTEQITVQLRAAADGATEGYLAVASAASGPAARRAPAAPLRLPAGARVLRNVESRDGMRVATQTVIATPATAAMTLSSLERAAVATGWTAGPVGQTRPVGARGARRDGVWLVRGADELGLFVESHASGALALVHHVHVHLNSREVK